MDNPYYDKLLAAAFRFVSYRPRSESEFTQFLRKKLKKWNVAGEGLLVKVKTRLVEMGYIDDDKFIAWWVSQRMNFRPKGMRAITQELMQRGITRSQVDAVVASLTPQDGFDEAEAARKAVRKKAVLWSRLPKIEYKKKLYTFLARRGFPSSIISRVIDELA